MAHTAELIAVGTELLLGNIANTNAQILSQSLSALGIDVHWHTVVGDNPQRLRDALDIAKTRADIIITTGGLGPTLDDLTKETLATVFGKKMVLHQPSMDRLTDFFKTIGREMTKNNEKQAWLPEGCIVLHNPNGTAPGCLMEADGKKVAVLPGPPREMRPMLQNELLPHLMQKGQRLVSHELHFYGIGESELEYKLHDLMAESTNPTIAPYAGTGEVKLRVTASLPEGEDAEAYRTRLSMKGIISQWSGTRRGVLYALTALGYDRSRIELFAEQDAERWAEFIIFLNSSKPSGVTNLSVIDAQVRKVKEGSSKPAYGMETIGGLIIRSQLQTGFSRYPRCGEIVCGVWPHIVSEGHLVASTVMAQGGASGGGNPFPRAGTFAASEEFYHFGAYTIYQGFASDIEAGSKAAQGAKVYLRCSASTRCSTNAKGDAAE